MTVAPNHIPGIAADLKPEFIKMMQVGQSRSSDLTRMGALEVFTSSQY
jgi:hypothetical protein